MRPTAGRHGIPRSEHWLVDCNAQSFAQESKLSLPQPPCPLLPVVEAAIHLPTTIPTKVGIQNDTGQYLFGLYHRTLIRILIRTSSNRKHRASLTASTLNLIITKMDCFHTSWCPGQADMRDSCNLMPGEQQASGLRATGLSGQAFRLSSE